MKTIILNDDEQFQITDCLTVGELKTELAKYDDSDIVLVFFDGGILPIYKLQYVNENKISFVEIGCGWSKLCFDEIKIIENVNN